MSTTRTTSRTTPRRTGPPLLAPAIAYAVLTLASVVLPPAIAGGSWYGSDASLQDFFAHQHTAVRTLALCTLASAAPLAIFTAVASSRLRTLGYDVPGRLIALVGGVVAAAMLCVSAGTSLALLQPHAAGDLAVVRAVYGLGFAAGGPAFVLFSGLLLAGVSVPALLGRLTPGWIAWFGLAIAALSELAVLVTAFDQLTFLLPVGRFGGLAWMIAIAAALPVRRPRRG